MLWESEDMLTLFKEFAHVTMNVQFLAEIYFTSIVFLVDNDNAFIGDLWCIVVVHHS